MDVEVAALIRQYSGTEEFCLKIIEYIGPELNERLTQHARVMTETEAKVATILEEAKAEFAKNRERADNLNLRVDTRTWQEENNRFKKHPLDS